MQANLEQALVVRVTGGEVWVGRHGGEVVPAVLRGRHRVREGGFRVAAGDRVRVRPPGGGGGAWTMEDLLPRTSRLSRWVAREAAERVIVANVERLYAVATLREPPIFYDFVDRVLVSAAWGDVPATVVLNKIDLVDPGEADAFESLYRSCGYPVARTSAVTGEGVGGLAAQVGTGVYAFAGASGVGKTSLVMSIDPTLDLKVRRIGERTGRGRHTTTFSQLYPFGRGYLADTPGVQTFGFPGREPAELAACFPEFAPFVEACRFRPCTHSHEPECGVKRALDEGAIAASRYRSYTNILAEVEERSRRPGR